MNDNCQEEIGFGQSVGIMLPPTEPMSVSDYMFFPQQKKVIDTINFTVFKVSEIKKIYLQKIKDEIEYQRSMDRRKTEARQVMPFTLSPTELGFLEACAEASDKRISGYKRILNRCVYVKNTNEGYDLATAKTTPISNYIKFNRAGFANCIWHNEKTPSMKYYEENNMVHCFGCGKSGDVLDVIMEMRGVTLPEAIKICLSIR